MSHINVDSTTFLRGAIVHWYPYPFLNVDQVGLWTALRNTGFVLVVAIVLMTIFKTIDRIRTVGVPRSVTPQISDAVARQI